MLLSEVNDNHPNLHIHLAFAEQFYKETIEEEEEEEERIRIDFG